MLALLTVAGGVALILFGVRFLRKGLDRLLGNQLGAFMQRWAGTRTRAFFAGLMAAVVAPSSTTMSVLAVQTVREGHLPPRRVLAVMLGANIGLTVMVLLLALRIDQYAPILTFVGVGLFQFTAGERSRGIGQVLLSLGFIFMGIGTISQTAREIAPSGDLVDLLRIFSHYPMMLALAAAVIALLLQSSTAAIGLVIGLASADLVDLDPMALALPAVIGANLGLGLTMLFVGWSRIDSRRLGLGNLLIKLVIALPLLVFTEPLVRWIGWWPLAVDQKIALAHSGFNVILALIFLPLIDPVYRLVSWLAPTSAAPATPAFAPMYLGSSHVENVALALGQSRHEILRVSAIVRGMLEDVWRALAERNPKLAHLVQSRDDQVDLLDREIKRYLARISAGETDVVASNEIMAQLRYINELETIGDVIDKNLAELVVKQTQHAMWFSSAGWAELDAFYRKVAENMLIAETAFSTRDQLLARQLLRHKQQVGEEERRLRDNHFTRLRQGQAQSHESSAIHLDILTHLKRINSCVAHVAYVVVQDEPPAS